MARTRDQITCERHDDWLSDYERGRSPTGRGQPRTVARIAENYGVTAQTVRNGIALARGVRGAVRVAD